MHLNHETKLELAGEALPADVQYELDGEGPEGIRISSVILKRCIHRRGEIVYHPDGDYHEARFPEYVELEIFNLLNGRQLRALAEEINADLVEKNRNDAMNEPNVIKYNFPTNFPGARL